jgi:hypothetical protein
MISPIDLLCRILLIQLIHLLTKPLFVEFVTRTAR